MKWPPVPENGRIPFVEGPTAAGILIMMTLSDLSGNPFNDPLLGLGDVTWRATRAARGRIEAALKRISRIVQVDSVEEKKGQDGSLTYLIRFQDLESRQRGEVTVDG